MSERYEIAGLGTVTLLSDGEHWGVRMPDGTVRGLYTDVNQVLGQFQTHLIAASQCGMRAEFLLGARVVRHRRLYMMTDWVDDDEANELVGELFPLVEQPDPPLFGPGEPESEDGGDR
ncbi:hypothetical protein [Nocardia otitidiscaviarum]|uniref:hypothetical protein n=1 Tax=Nocardia otitidiscaviarum TaxID=1823 RepID=UPI0004A6D044|nr:hypothetical protein [Nocardia otitidiscaviarum]